jgi:predicted enzyme related to lactoylglutathione lyase
MADWRGKFVWYELMTKDMAAAAAFYSGVIGWSAKDAGMAGMSYTLFSAGETMAGETMVCGMMAAPEEAVKSGFHPHWMGYVAVDDVNEAAAAFTEAGGVIHHGPGDIPGVGRFAVVSDPQGAVITVFKAIMAEGPPPPPRDTPGFVGWHELMAVDGAAAFAFYSAQFGWTKHSIYDMGPMGVYQLFATGGDAIGGMMTKPPSVPRPFWTYYFNVAGIDAAVERVKAGGGKIINGPHQVPDNRWIVQCADPQGIRFALLSPER